MPNTKPVFYKGKNHGSFDEEWGCHRRISEWWYATGYFKDENSRMYSYQYTLLRPRIYSIQSSVIMIALTDFETGKHYYMQKITLLHHKIAIDSRAARFDDLASLEKNKNGMKLNIDYKDFSLDLTLEYGKGAFWHGDNGLLRMGIDAPGETTVYFSYTNMPTSGALKLDGKTFRVVGKSWFDKQGGPYRIIQRHTHWEWFSLRFFDDEEIMLFTFPQSRYQDGTYIPGNNHSRRLTHYSITPLEFVDVNGLTFSSSWSLSVPGVKEEIYNIKPLMPGQFNFAYFELLAGIYNSGGMQVGLCFVELLPGVHNRKYTINLLKRVGRQNE